MLPDLPTQEHIQALRDEWIRKQSQDEQDHAQYDVPVTGLHVTEERGRRERLYMYTNSVQTFLHYTIHESQPFLPDGFYSDPTLVSVKGVHVALCFVKIYPRTQDEKNRVVFTYQHSLASETLPSPISSMEIPMVKEETGRLLDWFEIGIVLLPGILLRVQVKEPEVAAQDWAEMQVVLREREIVLMSSKHSKTDIEFLGDWNTIDELPSVSFRDIGYQFYQGEWLVRAGASLVHTGEPNSEVRSIHYDVVRQQFEYCLTYREGTEHPHWHSYRRWYDDLHDVMWNQALDLNRFDVGVLPQTKNDIPRLGGSITH